MLNFGIRYVPMYIHRILLYVLKIFSTYVLKVCDIRLKIAPKSGTEGRSCKKNYE